MKDSTWDSHSLASAPMPDGKIMLFSIINRHEPGGVHDVMYRLLDRLERSGRPYVSGWVGSGPHRFNNEWICPLYVRKEGDAAISQRPYHLPSLARLAAGLLRYRPKIVNVHFITEQTVYFFLLKRIFGYKLVLSFHGSDLLRPEEPWRDYLPMFLREADAITVVSRNMKERVRRVSGVDMTKVHVIPNGIDTDFWCPAVASGTAAVDPPVVVAAGRLHPVKGFDVLLAAMVRLRERVPQVRLCLMGQGAAEEDLMRQAEELGIREAVAFTGHLEKREMRERLRASSVFALSSRSEGMPLALLEAMACGLPAVATSVGGVKEVATEDAVRVVPPEDPDRLADALAGLIEDREAASRMSIAARQRSLAFSSVASEMAYLRLFDACLLDEPGALKWST